ncbi:MAG: phosphoserine phosphatase SerB [Betaproteobacteria bacterium]
MNLVAQGPAMTSAQADELGRRVSSSPETIAPGAFRFRNAARTDIGAWCEERRIDHAWMPEGRRFADLKLLAMDMDSTLICIECIDELGHFAGRKAAVAAITAQAMRGEIEYKESLRRRVAVLKGLSENVLAQVYEERLRLNPGAEELLAACRKHGVKLLLVSGGFSFFTERLKARLGLDYTLSNTLEVSGGKLTGALLGDIVDADAKAARFSGVLQALNAKQEESVAIGDGANDLKMMSRAGVSVAYRAKPVVRAQATCALTWCGLDAVLNLFE